jgi:predicted nuclease of predicted toxin-antitoxin system
MVRFLTDQDVDGDILRGLLRNLPQLDLLTAHSAGLSEAPDPELLEWAAADQRVVLTQDRRTMPDHASDRIRAGLPMRGVVVIPRRLPLKQVIDDLVLIATCSLEGEWENKVQFLPLK